MINNTVIEVLDREHGRKVIEFFKSKGVDTGSKTGICCREERDDRRFYGVVDGRFDHWFASDLKGVKIITLPEYPKVMEVSLLNKAFIIGAKEVVRTIQEDLDELYAERDDIESRISEKKRALEFYNKKIKEFSGD